MKLKKINRSAYAKLCGLSAGVSMGLVSVMPTFAAGVGTDKLQSFINEFIVPWLTLIGGVVALVGGVMFSLSWQREDAEGKSKGLMTIMAGFMIVGISQATNIFI